MESVNIFIVDFIVSVILVSTYLLKLFFYCVITSDSLLKISLFYNKLYFIAIIADPPDVGQTSDVLDQTSDVHVLRQMSKYI
jgi:hypothetical protein